MGPLRNLVASLRGAATLELALTAPMIAAAAVGAFDLMNGFAVKLDLEQAAQRATDLALVKRPVGDSDADIAYLKNEVAAAASPRAVTTKVDVYLTCDGVRQVSYSTVCGVGQSYARYVSISTSSAYEPIFDYDMIASVVGWKTIGSSFTVHGSSSVRVQ
jgi:Flp pilus assembly protein TadG